MNLKLEQARLFLKKAMEDECLIDEVLHSEKVSDEIIGFHCQQSAEKLFKALLSFLGVDFRRTHDLRELIDLLLDNAKFIPSHLESIDALTPFGTFFRYDTLENDSPFDRQKARQLIQELRVWVESEINAAL